VIASATNHARFLGRLFPPKIGFSIILDRTWTYCFWKELNISSRTSSQTSLVTVHSASKTPLLQHTSSEISFSASGIRSGEQMNTFSIGPELQMLLTCLRDLECYFTRVLTCRLSPVRRHGNNSQLLTSARLSCLAIVAIMILNSLSVTSQADPDSFQTSSQPREYPITPLASPSSPSAILSHLFNLPRIGVYCPNHPTAEQLSRDRLLPATNSRMDL
jgi:hypothetical protein